MDPTGQSEVPKPMREILGKPVLDWQIAFFQRDPRITGFIICTGYKQETITQHFQDPRKYGTNILWIADKSEGLGTEGALKEALRYIPSGEEMVLVKAADVFSDLDPGVLIDSHKKGQPITIVGVEGQINVGSLDVEDTTPVGSSTRTFRLKEMGPKTGPNKRAEMGDSAISILSLDAAEKLKEGGTYPNDFLQRLLVEGTEINGIVHPPGFWTNLTTEDDLTELTQYLEEGRRNYPPENLISTSLEHE